MRRGFLTLVCFSLAFFSVTAQQKNARYGNYVPSAGTIRIFVVFADVVDDTSTANVPHWAAGQLPEYKDSIVDFAISSTFKSQLTRIYHQSSFGMLNVVGDYYPHLVPDRGGAPC